MSSCIFHSQWSVILLKMYKKMTQMLFGLRITNGNIVKVRIISCDNKRIGFHRLASCFKIIQREYTLYQLNFLPSSNMFNKKHTTDSPSTPRKDLRPRSRTFDSYLSRCVVSYIKTALSTLMNMFYSRLSFRMSLTSPGPVEIGAPMNFQHHVNVRKQEDGTFTGMPDEWLTIMLKQVASDRENGDLEAAEAGARVLRFFQEFSRDGSRKKKLMKNAAGVSITTTAPPMSVPPTGQPRSPQYKIKKPPMSPNFKGKKNTSTFFVSQNEPVLYENDDDLDESEYDFIELTEAQEDMVASSGLKSILKGPGSTKGLHKKPSVRLR